MKILIFHSKTAGGHFKSAEALVEELRKIDKNLQIILKDALEKTNLGFKINPATSYRILSSTLLPLYNFFYFLTNNTFGIKVLRFLIKLGWGKQFKKMIEEENPDLILTTHHFISPSTIKNWEKKYPFITVVTDLGKSHRIWFDKKIDKIITPTKEASEHAKKIIRTKDNRIIHLGYPLKREFKAQSNIKFTNNVMLIGGGSGTGNIQKQVEVLQNKLPDKRLIVICGFNTSLFNKLSKIKNKGMEVYQFVDNLDKLMQRSDIIVSKAGPGTIIEAAGLKKPLIITEWVGLQEKDNVNFVLENNLGIFCPNLKELPNCIQNIYQNYSKYTSNKNDWGSAKKIAQYLNEQLSNL